MAEQSQARQNSWVQDLNNSVEEFQRRDKWTKILKISIFSVGGIVILLTLFIWSTGKLYFVFPKVTQMESIADAETPPLQTASKETKIETIEKPDLSTQFEEPIITDRSTQTVKPEIPQAAPTNYLKKHRPKNTLNAPPSVQQSPAISAKDDHETKTTFYASGNKWLELNYESGKQHGKQFGWYENGNPMYELNYVQGKKNGKQIWWDRSGKITTEKIYRNGEWLRKNDS